MYKTSNSSATASSFNDGHPLIVFTRRAAQHDCLHRVVSHTGIRERAEAQT